MPKQRSRLALIGAGRWGQNFIKTILRCDSAELVVVASNNSETRSLVPESCRVVKQWHEAVESPDVDGVIIASPPHTHFEILKRTIQQQKPAICEKPLVLSRVEADEVHALAEETNTTIFVDHVYLFHPAFRMLHELVNSGGGPTKVRQIRSWAGNSGPVRDDISVLWDWAPHDLAMILTILGEDPTALITESRRPHGGEASGSEEISIHLEFSGGRAGLIEISNALATRRRRLEVEMLDQTLIFDDADGPALQVENEGGRRVIEIDDRRQPLSVIVDEFCDAIRQPYSGGDSLALAVNVVRILETGRENVVSN